MNTHHNIQLVDLHKEDMDLLASQVSQRQSHEEFMNFLKEPHMTKKENLAIFNTKIDWGSVFKGVKLEWIEKLVGFFLFHNFDPLKKEIESSSRIDPNFQSKGIGSQARAVAVSEIVKMDTIDSIVSWHSALNRKSFGLNKNSWFKLSDFVPQQTFLPNLNVWTDDFKRSLDEKTLTLWWNDLIHRSVSEKKREEIMDALKHHNFI